MLRPGLGRYVLMPVFGLAAFVLIVQVLGVDRHSAVFSETGFVELGTAACFMFACGLALRLGFASNDLIPKFYRVLFRMFAFAACFVALEEINYGQYIFGWQGPEFLTERNSKHEANLHNLYGDRLSNFLRDVANLAFPTCCVVLPLVVLSRRKQLDPTHWTYYLLPKAELISIVVLAQAMSPLDKFSKRLVGVNMLVRPGELQELFWSIAAAVYVYVIYQRVLRNTDQPDVIAFPQLSEDQSELRKAA
jgi:hypothetical protein